MVPYIENTFTYKGFKCVVLFQVMGHRCGYVGIPKNNPLYGVDYGRIDIDCHGGLTYSWNSLFGQPDGLWWIGFDCAHPGDGIDFGSAYKYFDKDQYNMDYLITEEANQKRYPTNDVIRSQEYVEAECRNIVDQILKKKKRRHKA